MPTIEWFDSTRDPSATPPTPDLVEVNRVGDAHIHTRSWHDGELIGWQTGAPAVPPEGAVMVELLWGSPDEERAYWNEPFTSPLPHAQVVAGGWSGELTTAPDFLERFAPATALPDASFSLVIECTGFTLHPTGTHLWKLHLRDGRPGEPDDADAEPDLRILGSADLVVGWLSGERLLSELMAELTVEGEILMLGAVAGAMGIAGGFEIPPELGPTSRTLVSLVQDHRAVLDDFAGVQFG